MKIANSKANDQREQKLWALEEFANLGEEPADWKRFRLKNPDFFPEELSNWLYRWAETVYSRYRRPGSRVKLDPPLLFYSQLLRKVWSRNDIDGNNLKFLYGFEKDTKRLLNTGRLIMPADLKARILIPGQSLDENEHTTIAGLPPGKPVVNGVTGEITWAFGCSFQQSIYELMQQRWRAMVCPECGRFFLADKTRQKYCSPRCFGEVKRKRALVNWNLRGNAERLRRRAKKGRGR